MMKNVLSKTKTIGEIIRQQVKLKKEAKGITLIALVVTIVVLLILARNKYCNFSRGQSVY